MVVIPAAIAWACNPQAHISLDKTTYEPGQTITVYGSYFPDNVRITVTGPGETKTVTTSGGAFVTTFTAPGDGTYTITASRPTGGFASAAFTSATPARSAPPPQQQDSPPAGAPRTPSLDSPGVVRSERRPSSTGGRGDSGPGGGGGNAQGSPGGGAQGPGGSVQTQSGGTVQTVPGTVQTVPGSGVQTVAGQPVFAGSAAPATAGTFATTPAPAAERERAAQGEPSASAAPSQQAATGDVWSGFAPGRTASLTSGADGIDDGGTGSELGLGIGLLALGLVALAGGLAAAEVRRRRAA
jgi:hypothetical protein